MSQYVRKRVQAGGLQRWNVAVIGLEFEPHKASVELPDGTRVGSVVRTRINATKGDKLADIKTLTGSRDTAVDLDVPAGMQLTRSTMQQLRLKQQPERGLVLLYPIDGHAASAREDRHPLAAPVDTVWGAALVFPKPSSGVDVDVDYNYVAADLARVFPTAAEDDEKDVDLAILEEDQDVYAGPVGGAAG